jgi:hypothetical protein
LPPRPASKATQRRARAVQSAGGAGAHSTGARPNRRWYGVYANYNTPAYNTRLVKKSELPRSYEQFLDRKKWAGKIALDDTDDEWLSAMIGHYGEDRGKKLLKDIVATLKPVMVDGQEAELFLTKRGRMPTRPDVPVNPAHVSEMLKERKIVATIFAGEERRKWQGLFKEIFRPR